MPDAGPPKLTNTTPVDTGLAVLVSRTTGSSPNDYTGPTSKYEGPFTVQNHSKHQMSRKLMICKYQVS